VLSIFKEFTTGKNEVIFNGIKLNKLLIKVNFNVGKSEDGTTQLII